MKKLMKPGPAISVFAISSFAGIAATIASASLRGFVRAALARRIATPVAKSPCGDVAAALDRGIGQRRVAERAGRQRRERVRGRAFRCDFSSAQFYPSTQSTSAGSTSSDQRSDRGALSLRELRRPTRRGRPAAPRGPATRRGAARGAGPRAAPSRRAPGRGGGSVRRASRAPRLRPRAGSQRPRRAPASRRAAARGARRAASARRVRSSSARDANPSYPSVMRHLRSGCSG